MSATRAQLVAVGAALAAGFVATAAGGAAGFWSSADQSSPAVAMADALPSGPAVSAPAVTAGNTVSFTFAQSVTTVDGAPVAAYVVDRYPAGGGEAVTADAQCSVSDGTVSCSEPDVPDGSWQYTVTPVIGSWSGSAGPPSDVVVVSTGGG